MPRRNVTSDWKERDHVYDDNGSGGVWKYSGGAEVKTDVFWQTDMESE